MYCGMTYTGSSCEDIYLNNAETGDTSEVKNSTPKWGEIIMDGCHLRGICD